MLLTKASEYAMLTLVILSQEEKPQGADKLAFRLNISKSFLAKILQALAKENILKSYRGTSGGFLLAKPPKEITIREIIETAEKKPVSVFVCSANTHHCPNGRGEFCDIWPFLHKLQNKLSDYLEEITLQDLLEG